MALEIEYGSETQAQHVPYISPSEGAKRLGPEGETLSLGSRGALAASFNKVGS